MNTPATMNPIAILNDRLRTTFLGGKVLCTVGIQAMNEADQRAVIQPVQSFNDFNPENDPYGEHDFGMVVVGNQSCYFKVDYYDLEMLYRSEDPADSTKTKRVLTIMLAVEY